ncbi:MAG: XRE family transcriptional regulator [Candidatus Zixiibacteriota bacterium]|nr:MAG: XRE family transcriptional regulator [candidate division Zixibacteria bacterium]
METDPIITEINKAREKLGLSYRAMADAAQTSHSTLWGYLTGQKQPGLAVARRLCKAVGLELTVKARR